MEKEKICRIIEDVFELPKGSIDVDATSADIEDWDSLGQFSILEYLDKNYNDVTITYPALAQASSIIELYNLGLSKVDHE